MWYNLTYYDIIVYLYLCQPLKHGLHPNQAAHIYWKTIAKSYY